MAWYDDNSGSKTHNVGQKQKNGLGLYDMSGNVWEWVEDSHETYPPGTETDPKVTGGSSRVLRGGSWLYRARSVRAAYRYSYSPGNSVNYLGFRLARTL